MLSSEHNTIALCTGPLLVYPIAFIRAHFQYCWKYLFLCTKRIKNTYNSVELFLFFFFLAFYLFYSNENTQKTQEHRIILTTNRYAHTHSAYSTTCVLRLCRILHWFRSHQEMENGERNVWTTRALFRSNRCERWRDMNEIVYIFIATALFFSYSPVAVASRFLGKSLNSHISV